MFGIRYSSPFGMILLMILGFFVGLMIVYFVFLFIHTQQQEQGLLPSRLHGIV
jgi:F0F1-type ATP synthase assembly protein I